MNLHGKSEPNAWLSPSKLIILPSDQSDGYLFREKAACTYVSS